jgi:DNA mismatch repair protein MutL
MAETKRVRVLNPAIAEKIAAGEVIERPASVVKELVENSLDAGATEILVLLQDGGKELIEITDNGSGIHPEDLPICVQRHATSKLSELADLERISTLGFRGEALPSIGAVAEVSLLSRAKGESTAYELNLAPTGTPPNEPKAVTFGHFLSSPHGTRIQARGLFSQIPARLKFLKSQGAEVAQVREWIERLALAHPGVGFRLVSDQRSVLQLRPQEETARVRAILSDGGDYPIVTSSNDLGFRERTAGALHVRAHWLQGLSAPQSKRVVQVVNGRSVRDRMLQQAILTAFKQALLPGQFPAIALFVEIDPAEIDVNVHPTKTEIRFLESRKVFQAVEGLVSSMIESHGAPAFVPQRFSGGFETPSSPSFNPPPAWRTPEPWRAAEPATTPSFSFTSPPTAPTQPSIEPAPQPMPKHSALASLGLTRDRYVGVAFNTYLFYDLGEELALIDQHAAHERIRYEKLKSRALAGTQSSQNLLIPEAVHFSPEEKTLLEPRLPWLASLGFETEVFGEESLLFRAVPADWGTNDLRTRLKNLVDRLIALDETDAGDSSMKLDETLFEKLASEACHSAIRAGDRLERDEALELVDQLFACEHPWNCPHGRPTVARIPKGKLEEWFQRRV